MKINIRQVISVFAFQCYLVLAVYSQAAEIPRVECGPADRSGISLVLYNNDLAFISETRSFSRREGAFELEFAGVGRTILPASVSVRSGGGLEVVEQHYDYDVLSRRSLLESYIGRQIALERLDKRTQTLERLSGRLLSLEGGVIVQFDDGVAIDPEGTLILPAVPAGLVLEPKLSWLVNSPSGGSGSLEVSYVARGFGWECDYLLELETGGRAGLSAWVTVHNNSGADYQGAKLVLVAGDVHSTTPAQPLPRGIQMETSMLAAKADIGGMEVQKSFEYYRYDLGRPVDLNRNQLKQVELFGRKEIKLEKIYRLEGGQNLYFRTPQTDERPRPVAVLLEWENAGANSPGLPLPAGTVRVYDRSSRPGLFLGEDRIGHTPQAEKVTVRAGAAFDVLGRRRQVDYQRLSDRLQRTTLEVELTNRSAQAVTVQMDEALPGDWKITDSTHRFEKLDANRARFSPQVPAGGKAVVRFTVEYI
ncbi:MAG: DUF4139 domain-containing protein [Candidatus Glassbacteria bacterium]